MKNKTKNTLYILITCSLDESRHDCLEKCISSINRFFPKENISNDFFVFDNASTVKKTNSLIKNTFSHVYRSEKNIGLWSAVNWVLENYEEKMKRRYSNVFLVESDLVFYNFESFVKIENIFEQEKFKNIGSCRTKEFSVKDKHLFDKYLKTKDSVFRSLCTQRNLITNKPIYYNETNVEGIYVTNFNSVICSMSRIQFIKEIFKKLESKDDFTELEYFKEAQMISNETFLLDGGCHFEASMDVSNASNIFKNITGSHSKKEDLEKIGYHGTRRNNKIIKDFIVKKV